jgi:hypothetical protein
LLNLIQSIVIDGNFFNESMVESKLFKGEDELMKGVIKNAKSLFIDEELSKCIVDGMRSNAPIVRYHYICFSDKIVRFMQ